MFARTPSQGMAFRSMDRQIVAGRPTSFPLALCPGPVHPVHAVHPRQRGTQEREPAHAAPGLIIDPSFSAGDTRIRTPRDSGAACLSPAGGGESTPADLGVDACTSFFHMHQTTELGSRTAAAAKPAVRPQSSRQSNELSPAG